MCVGAANCSANQNNLWLTVRFSVKTMEAVRKLIIWRPENMVHINPLECTVEGTSLHSQGLAAGEQGKNESIIRTFPSATNYCSDF